MARNKAKQGDDIAQAEKSKYERMWEDPDYRVTSPGLRDGFKRFFEYFKPYQLETVIDLGCGSGKAGKAIHDQGLRVVLFDIAENCLNEDVRQALGSLNLVFIQGCLWDIGKKLPIADYLFCTDVMEHIPPEKVDAVIEASSKIMLKGGLFQIALFHEGFGARIGETLHLTVEPPEFWIDAFGKHFHVEEAEITSSHVYLYVRPKGHDDAAISDGQDEHQEAPGVSEID